MSYRCEAAAWDTAPRTPKLFISYRSTDSAKVDAMVARMKTIQNDGALVYAPWQDKHDVPVGKDWWESIVDAIIDSQIFVFNISKAALESDVCRAELAYAYKRNRPIIPVVLEGEYRYNTTTGKFDIDYWDKIPDELNDSRAQFLFYEGGPSFFQKFEAAMAEFQRKGFRDTPVPRPLNPDSKEKTRSNHVLYAQACEYAGHLAFDEAEKSFRRLMQRNDEDYGQAAHEWIELLMRYKELIEIDEQASAWFVFKRKWEAYKRLFPKEFLDEMFDPKAFANRASGDLRTQQTTMSVAPQMPIVVDPPLVPPNTVKANIDKMLREAIGAYRNGNKSNSRSLLDKVLEIDEYNETAWMWMSAVADTAEERHICLENVLVINPKNEKARRGLEILDLEATKSIAWISIPAGKVTLEEGGYVPRGGQTFNVPAFQIAKYPVTNTQYAKFIEAGGYREKRWWSEAGWILREKESWSRRRYWTNNKFKGAEQPVVGVSWYEAVAFCLWLSEIVGESVTLPTEQQWQRAAQGNKGLAYPWGNDWDPERCNNNSDQTTSVRQYEDKGKSPYGVVDMAGNVWEWCITGYENGSVEITDNTNERVLRGGSWDDTYPNNFRAANRGGSPPDYWLGHIGFRCARSFESPSF